MNILPFIGSLTVTGSSEITSSNALYNGNTILTTNLTGSLLPSSTFNNFTASYNTGSFRGSFTGSLSGTSSVALTASFIATSSFVFQNLGFIMESTNIQNGVFNGTVTGNNRKWVSPSTGLSIASLTTLAPTVGFYWDKATIERIVVILDAPLPSTLGYGNITLTTHAGGTIKETFTIPTGSSAGPIVFTPNPNVGYFSSLSVNTLGYSLLNTGIIDIPASPNILGKIITYIRLT